MLEPGEGWVERCVDLVVVGDGFAGEQFIDGCGDLVGVDHGVGDQVAVGVPQQVRFGGDCLGALEPGGERRLDVVGLVAEVEHERV